MLSEMFAEIIRFLSRESLDALMLVSSTFVALINRECPKYPLRRLESVYLSQDNVVPSERLTVDAWKVGANRETHRFISLSDSLIRLKTILSHSFLERFLLENFRSGNIRVTADDWRLLLNSFANGHVGRVDISNVDLRALSDRALFDLTTSSGLAELHIRFCVVPASFVQDAFLRHCQSASVRLLSISRNDILDGDVFSLSEDGVLEFCFPNQAMPNAPHRRWLNLDCFRVSPLFLKKLLQV